MLHAGDCQRQSKSVAMIQKEKKREREKVTKKGGYITEEIRRKEKGYGEARRIRKLCKWKPNTLK
jgi:hypothetical protein